jgi:hypothetical protein
MVVGVVGGSGGVGATGFAAALAAAAARRYGRSVLLDLDPGRGGVDVQLGVEAEPGARWSGLRLAGGHLDPEVLTSGLPHWGDVAVLAADGSEPSAPAVAQVVEVGQHAGPVVADLCRHPTPARAALIARCDLVVLIARADVSGVTGARTVAAGVDAPLGLLVRGRSGRDLDELIGAARLGRLPRGRRLEPTRSVRLVAAGVLDAVERAR